MAGNRTGYLVGPPAAVSQALKISTHTFYAAPTAGQLAGLRALRDGAAWVESARAGYREVGAARRRGARRAGARGRRPSCSSTSAQRLDARGIWGFLEDCLDDGVALAPGPSCGEAYAGWVRLCFTAAAPDAVLEAVRKLAKRLALSAQPCRHRQLLELLDPVGGQPVLARARDDQRLVPGLRAQTGRALLGEVGPRFAAGRRRAGEPTPRSAHSRARSRRAPRAPSRSIRKTTPQTDAAASRARFTLPEPSLGELVEAEAEAREPRGAQGAGGGRALAQPRAVQVRAEGEVVERGHGAPARGLAPLRRLDHHRLDGHVLVPALGGGLHAGDLLDHVDAAGHLAEDRVAEITRRRGSGSRCPSG